jgi:YggT family protein
MLVVVVQAVLSYFMSPDEPIRQFIDRVVDPFLAPIRRVLPPTGGLDFSPMVLIVILYLLDMVFRWILV